MALLACFWVVAMLRFWMWWPQPAHEVTTIGLVLNSGLLLYLSWFPIGFILAVLRLRRVDPGLPLPDLRVAFVVTKAPSEPWHIVRATLEAMLDQQHPSAPVSGPNSPLTYHVWLCDEDPSDETVRWCENHGVGLSSRRDVDAYHRAEWPRRTRCKEGNLALFYDRWGYDNYDVAVQLDADHVPSPTYLAQMVKPFANPAVGYVAAPSVCDTNAAESWAARGRLYREAVFHGPIQAGHTHAGGPLCIGSHYAVRTKALRDTGGIGPELAEDFTTTLLMNAAGWSGAFALEAVANGEGPPTLEAMLTQEFQWSRSLMVVLLGLFPSTLHRLDWRQRVRFGYALAYYPVSVLVLTVGLLLAPLACILGVPWVRVSYFEFLSHWWAISAPLLVLNLLLRRWGLFRPQNTKLLSWEGGLYGLVRWPYNAWGVLSAIVQRVVPRNVVFKVTPKGSIAADRLRTRQLAPYLVVATAALVGAAAGLHRHGTRGYVFLSLLSCLTYLVVAATVVRMHIVENSRRHGIRRASLWRAAWRPISLVALLLVAFLSVTAYGVREVLHPPFVPGRPAPAAMVRPFGNPTGAVSTPEVIR